VSVSLALPASTDPGPSSGLRRTIQPRPTRVTTASQADGSPFLEPVSATGRCRVATDTPLPPALPNNQRPPLPEYPSKFLHALGTMLFCSYSFYESKPRFLERDTLFSTKSAFRPFAAGATAAGRFPTGAANCTPLTPPRTLRLASLTSPSQLSTLSGSLSLPRHPPVAAERPQVYIIHITAWPVSCIH
jgi:hypothetical protein